jgi:glycosyltransferase involved in cell wall biosynthesis
MRLVHYYPRALVGDGGPTRAMWQWVSAAHGAGCEVAVLYDAALVGPSSFRNPAIQTIGLAHSGVGLFRAPRSLAEVLIPDDVLVLHSTYVPANLSAAWTAHRRGVPYIVMPHGGYNSQSRQRRWRRKQAWLPLERAYLDRALAVHVFFETETHDAAQVASNARWLIAPTGFHMPTARWDGGTGGYVAWIGRYDIRTKGIDLLVHAIGRLPVTDRRPLRLYGRVSEDSPEDISRLARLSGLADFVTVGGELPECDKGDFLRRSIAYVHPSRWESHSIAIIEALAYGIPSVISKFCSIAPNLHAAQAAVIVDATPDDIARGISTVLRAPQHYSESALEFVRTSLNWNLIARDYVRQIENLLRRK